MGFGNDGAGRVDLVLACEVEFGGGGTARGEVGGALGGVGTHFVQVLGAVHRVAMVVE